VYSSQFSEWAGGGGSLGEALSHCAYGSTLEENASGTSSSCGGLIKLPDGGKSQVWNCGTVGLGQRTSMTDNTKTSRGVESS
jgi:hypothetical protein